MDDRISERIQQIIDGEIDESFITMELNPFIRKSLFLYQHLHIRTLITSFMSKRILIDGSDTGTGKTYVAAALCRQLNLRPVVLCPKTVTYEWQRVCDIFQVKPYTVTNYELMRNGKQLNNGKAVTSKFIKWKKDTDKYTWKLPNDAILIFDEVHRCKNINSMNGKLLHATKNISNKQLMLSATLCDKPSDFKLFGLLLGFYDDVKQANNWIKGELIDDKSRKTVSKSSLAKTLYPINGSCMLISDLGDKFPKNQVIANPYTLNDKNLMKQITKSYKILANTEDKSRILADIITERRKIEEAKISLFVDLIDEHLDNGFSVAVFVNFRATLKSIKKIMKDKEIKCSLVYGGQDSSSRQKNIEKFQKDSRRVILCNIKAGGESISLHDTRGNYRRVSLISPSFSSIEIQQALGRIYRAGSKTPALQRLVFVAGSYEEHICKCVEKKLKFGQALADSDLTNGQPWITTT